MPSIYKNALQVQDASNISGVVFQFAKDMLQILAEVRSTGGGTNQVNTHPVARMYAEQIAWLTKAGTCSSHSTYRRALHLCQQKVKEEESAVSQEATQ
jgi:hypothetical protein